MPTTTNDPFERLGLPRRFSVNLSELERHYLERSREAHPDFANGDEDTAAALNEAYATLKDPFRRAEHLLRLLGGPTAKDDKSLPPAFLMEMLELREAIEAAKGSSTDAARIEADLVGRTDALAASLDGMFEADAPPASIRLELNCVRYLKGLLRDLQQ